MSSQHMEALEQANRARCERGAIKREIKSGERSLPQMLREGVPACMEKMYAEKLLCCAPRVGPKAARRLLEKAVASPFKLAGDLSERQRSIIAANLELKEQSREIKQRDREERERLLGAAA